MTVYKETIQLESHGGTPSFINITDSVRTAIKNSGVQGNGTCTVISPTPPVPSFSKNLFTTSPKTVPRNSSRLI